MRLLTKVMGFVAGAALLFSANARAQTLDTSTGSVIGSRDLNWSATSGRTVGMNNAVLQAEAGWPGIGLTYLKGYNDLTDYGFRVGLNYGFEGTTNTATGLNLAVPIRRNIVPGDRLNVAVHVDPGVVIYSNSGSALVGVGGPIGVVAGYNLDPRLSVNAGVDVPILVSFANPTALLFGPQFGGGAEYLLDKDLSVSAKVRVGPQFALATTSTTQVAFQTLLGVAYNLR